MFRSQINREYAFHMLARLSRLRCVPLVILVALTAPISNSQEIPASDLIVDGFGKGAVPLSGPWRFHLGDNAPLKSIPTENAVLSTSYFRVAHNLPATRLRGLLSMCFRARSRT